MRVAYCDVCKAQLGPADTALRVAAGPLKHRKEINLCESHTQGLVGLLDGDPAVPAGDGRPPKGRKAGTPTT
jgi:hypothetical protein